MPQKIVKDVYFFIIRFFYSYSKVKRKKFVICIVKKDKRHTNIKLVFEEVIVERMFSQWSMVFNNTNQFIRNIDFLLKNNDSPTKAEDMFWCLAKLIVLS